MIVSVVILIASIVFDRIDALAFINFGALSRGCLIERRRKFGRGVYNPCVISDA